MQYQHDLWVKELGPKVNHVGSQPRLHNQLPIKPLDTQARASSPGWPYSAHAVTFAALAEDDRSSHCSLPEPAL